MSVRENMSYGLKIARVDKATIDVKVREVADILGLQALLDRRPGQLSGGQRQRVAMGRAIIREPKVFLFDEPLSNLDAKLRHQMRMELKRLHIRLNATSVLVTHDQVEAMSLATQLVLMNAGVVEQVGTPTEIYNQPATLFTAGFVGSLPMNFFPGNVNDTGNQLILENGTHVPFTRDLREHAGKKIVLGIRPDAMQIVPASTEGTPLFQGNLELSEDLGSLRLLHIRHSTGEFAVAVSPEKAMHGALAATAIERDLHLFDAVTERRI